MPAYVWIALGVFSCASSPARSGRSSTGCEPGGEGRPALRRMNAASASLNGRSSELERRLATLEPKTSQLQRDVARLQRSVARIRVLFRRRPWGQDGVSLRTFLHVLTLVAAVDLGTNSTRLLVADVDDSRVDEVARRLEITRLGEGVDTRRRLLPLPIARVRNCLADFRRELESARRGADARHRDERRARRRERRGVPRRDRVELRLHDAAALRA